VAAQSDGFDGWFDDVSNVDGVVDRRGNDGVVVEVGVDANGGAFGFGPVAVRVSPGTTVRWEWTGEGGGHNVVADGGTFNSGEPDSSADTTFEHTFEETGTYLYVCTPHEAIGMKGAVVVQEGGGSGVAAQSLARRGRRRDSPSSVASSSRRWPRRPSSGGGPTGVCRPEPRPHSGSPNRRSNGRPRRSDTTSSTPRGRSRWCSCTWASSA
jgi:halocyanin-like protein